jgi:hypothetical protein
MNRQVRMPWTISSRLMTGDLDPDSLVGCPKPARFHRFLEEASTTILS